MKSSYRSQYGPPAVLSVVDALVPVPKDDELLIRVHAATVNRTDCAILLGKPFVMRFFCGLLKPTHAATGCDFAGEVHATGKSVTRFKVGDRVWGFDDEGLGSHSQYLTLSQSKAMAKVPDGISCQQAAASAEGAHYALNFLNKVVLKPGHSVMLNGATGAIGSALLQLIKHHGAQVTATCATPHIERVRALGADRVIDYSIDDFTRDRQRYDVVFDAVGKSTFGRCRPLLKPGGVYISSELGPYVQNPLLALVTPLLGGKKVVFPLPFNPQASLDVIQGLLEKRAFNPLIDRTFPLEEIQAAFKLALSGEKIGNVVLTLD
jgi:NADPH:quinone reductase-like Zn-dependent oxidoreductase